MTTITFIGERVYHHKVARNKESPIPPPWSSNVAIELFPTPRKLVQVKIFLLREQGQVTARVFANYFFLLGLNLESGSLFHQIGCDVVHKSRFHQVLVLSSLRNRTATAGQTGEEAGGGGGRRIFFFPPAMDNDGTESRRDSFHQFLLPRSGSFFPSFHYCAYTHSFAI